MRKLLLASVALLAGTLTVATTELDDIADNFNIYGNGFLEECASEAACGVVDTELGEAKLRFFCNPSHLKYDDPIVNPGQPGATHLHHFFGNTLADAHSTYATLRTTGDGTCQGGAVNRTAYWMPAMIDGATNKVIKPRMIEWYYRSEPHMRFRGESVPGQFTSPHCPGAGGTIACPTYGAQDIPRGLKLITGYNFATQAKDSGILMYWACVNPISGSIGALTDTFYHRTNSALGQNDCTNSGTGINTGAGDRVLQVTFSTRTCWNGDLDHADHRSHTAVATTDASANPVCPATHPYVIPNFSVIVQYDFDTDSSDFGNWYLSSDRFNGADYEAGTTFHGDMFWAWSQETMDLIAAHVWDLADTEDYNTTIVGGLAEAGYNLSNDGQNVSTYIPEVSRRLDLPTPPIQGRGSRIRGRLR
jgi:hypothetical protein